MTHTVQVPAELAKEIVQRLDDLATEIDMRVAGHSAKVGEAAIRDRLWDACDRLRACPGYEDPEPADVDTSGADELDYDDETCWTDDLADTEDDTP
jgi:hypothetical protein